MTPSLLIADIRRQALHGPDSGSKFAMAALRLCDEYEALEESALALERIMQEQNRRTS